MPMRFNRLLKLRRKLFEHQRRVRVPTSLYVKRNALKIIVVVQAAYECALLERQLTQTRR